MSWRIKCGTQLSYVESIPKLSQHGFCLGLTLELDLEKKAMETVTYVVSSLSCGMAFEKSGQEIGKFLTSFEKIASVTNWKFSRRHIKGSQTT